MKVGIALLVGAVLLLLVVESVYDPHRTTNHVRDSQTNPRVDFADENFSAKDQMIRSRNNDKLKKLRDYKTKAAGITNNKDPSSNEPMNYGNNKQKRRRRSIKKKLADRKIQQREQNEGETPLDAEKPQNKRYKNFLSVATTYLELPEIKSKHKIRHHHDLKFRKDNIILLNTTPNDSQNEKLKVRYRILTDDRSQIERRKRYSYITKDGVVHYTYTPAAPCNGWGYYDPYRCVPCQCTRESCVRPCENVGPRTFPGPKPFPAPHLPQKPSQGHKPEIGHPDYGTTTYKPPPPIYSGVGKYWVGPRLGCNCNPRGSEISTCDITTGQCRCKPFYVGRTCDKCQDGYWESINGCNKCECDLDGSRATVCNQRTGQCDCKPGVGGLLCDTCLSNYFGFSATGCKACEPCNKKGHFCDPDTGRCICPPYSHGEFCHLCTINTWGYEPNKGCKACNCSNSGSSKMQCNLNTGECSCRLGYTGFHCNRCALGYFGYPRCRRCNCNFAGTDRYKAKCDKTGVCHCNEDGSCPCKPNVSGKRCDECKDGTFGLHLDNPDGCTQCFCFGRSSKCTEAGLTWGQIRTNSSRMLTIDSKAKPRLREGQIHEIEVSEKLLVIPGVHGNVSINGYHFDSPLYWKLHPVFNGDRVLSYGGYLRFISHTYNSRQRLPQDILNHYPLVQLRGQGRIVLEYYPPLPSKSNRHEVRLHESLWKRTYPKETHLSPRELLMVTLQNIQGIFIKATDSAEFETLVLQDVILDTAIEIPGHPPPLAKGVEMCECPGQYNSSSCQNPSIGFFRHYTPTSVNGTILIDMFIGQAKPCECNGRSNICDTETGYCWHCKSNTDGRYCEKCAEGFYGNPMIPFGKCEPCPCPSTSRNFAKECKQLPQSNQFVCKCKSGYSGSKCDKCSLGYYGQPQTPGGSCQPCNCNIEGRASDECDSETGQCNCKPGIIGNQCSQCEKPRHILQKFKCTPCDKCTQWLLDDIDSLSNQLYLNANFLQNGTIQPPWNTLKNLEKRYEHLDDKLASYLKDKLLAEELITNASLNELENHLYNMQDRLKKREPEKSVQKGKDLLKDTQQVANDIHESKHQLQKLIDTLQNFGKSHVSTKEAVKQAREIMRQINNIAKNMKYPHKEVLQKCINVTQLIEKMSVPITDPEELKRQLSKLNHRIKELEKILTETEMTNNEADLKNRANEIQISRLSEKLNNIKKSNYNMEDEIIQTKKTINETIKTLNETRKIYDLILYDSEFNDLVQKLGAKDAELSVIGPDEYLQPVLQHVLQLEKNATEYAKLFNLSSKEIDALKASEAYANIKKFLDEAEKSANEAISEVNTALDTLSPEGKDSIAVNTSISLADSERLGIRVKHQRENLAAIKQRKDSLTNQVSTLDSTNWSNGLKNRDQDNTLGDIKSRLNRINQQKIEDLIRDAIEQTNRIKDIHRKIMDINMSKEYELEKPLQRLLNLTTSDKLRELQEKIDVTKDELKNIFERNHTYLDIIKENTNKYTQFKVMNNSISTKLEQLKAKIESAKKTAEGIQISLAGPNCSRSYMINDLSPTLLTKLTVKFNYTMSTEPNSASSLFYLPTASSDQFMNLKIVNDVLQFEWKLGNKVNKLELPLNQSDSYKVDIDRIGEFTEMTITSKEVQPAKTQFKNDKSENENVVFKANPTDLLHVGLGPNIQPGIPGCIRDIIFDDFRIGLWNFHNASGQCLGCIRNNDLTLESTYDFYRGDGYSLISKEQQEKYANPSKFNVQFSLRTFDENALLFLAADPERKNYIAITLKDGYIQYVVHYPNSTDIVLTTKQKYNNGEKVRVSAEKAWIRGLKQDTAVLKINDEANPLSQIRKNIESGALIRLKKVNYYFGGVPPGYFLDSLGTTASLHTHESILGGLEELKEYQLFSDDNIKKYGVVKQSGELEFRKAWFEGLGYVQLKTKKLENKMILLLRTKEANGFIMFMKDTVLFAMNDGKLNSTVYISGNSHNLNSKQIINDDEYYLIELVRLKKKTTLKINGIPQDTVKHGEISTNKNAEDTASIYIGGVPDTLSSVLERNTLFSGGISDIVIDKEIINFNKRTIQTFKNVKIGRAGPQSQKAPKNLQRPSVPDDSKTNIDGGPFNMKEMQNTEGCGKPLNYTFDPSAAKFGDKRNSHVLHYLKDSFWKKDYTLEMQFRTLQPNGMLFLSYGPRQHFNLLEIKNGKLNFKANGKRKKEIMLPQKVDDGQWYNIILETSGVKKKRKLTIAINGYRTKPLRPPKNKVTRELFIGGISENVTIPSIIRSDWHPFRGCIRGLKINKISQSLVRDKNTIHHNIGQCFPHIEKGSYFGGDAHAIYSKLFHIDKILELSLEFRTTEQSGILLSVSNARNSPALSVELQNGAIVMTTDNGYGTITNVTNNLSDFALCNNQWHNVTAVYTSTEITINVDGIRKIWVQPDDETLMDELEAPLYIGGLPDYAPAGTLKMKENFKGCIRNMKIGNTIVNWINMEKVTNILMDSCPMIS